MLITIKKGTAQVTVDLSRGGDIISYQDDRIGGEVLWRRNPAVLSSAASSELNHNTQAFYDSYQGGIQELFPNTADATTVLEAELPFHGELCRTPLNVVDQSESYLKVTGHLKRYPVQVTRVIEISSKAVLTLTTTVKNMSARDLPYTWALHPVFSEFFTGEGAVVWCNASQARAHPVKFSSAQTYQPGTQVTLEEGELGQYIPLSPPHSGTADLVYVEVEENWFQLGRPDKLNVAMRWTNPNFNCLWLWQECHVPKDWPWWGQYHVVGVEPHTAYPATGLSEHIGENRHRTLEANQTIESVYSLELVRGIKMGKVIES